MKLKYIPITQKGLTYYVSVAAASDVIDKVNVNRRTSDKREVIVNDLLNLEENLQEINDVKIGQGLQRELVKPKVDEIANYLEGEYGLIPNSIILNISDPLNLVQFNNYIEIPDDVSITLTALDGQHRIEGIKKFLSKHPTENYEIPITIFYNSELEFQAFLFSTINSKQTKINKSFLYDLLALTKNQVDEFKLSHEIAYWLNDSNESALKGNFKLLGKGDGWLSQAAFIDYLFPHVYVSEKKDSSNVIFKRYIKEKRYNEIADFINEYFSAIIKVFKDEFFSSNFIFRTSFIFGVLMKIMPYAFIYATNLKSFTFSTEKLNEFVFWIKDSGIDFRKGGMNSGIGSSGRQNKIVSEIIGIIRSKVEIDSMIKDFRSVNQ